MSRPIGRVSDQLLQSVMIPITTLGDVNGTPYYQVKADLCNIRSITADTINVATIVGQASVDLGNPTTGLLNVGVLSMSGSYTSKSNATVLGVGALGAGFPHGNCASSVVIGKDAAFSASNAVDSVIIGKDAARSSTVPTSVVIGMGALSNGNANTSVVIGPNALRNGSVGNSVIIGPNVAQDITGSETDILVIHNNPDTVTSPLIYGVFGNDQVYSGKIGINRRPQCNFDMYGNMRVSKFGEFIYGITTGGGAVNANYSVFAYGNSVGPGYGIGTPSNIRSDIGGVRLSNGIITGDGSGISNIVITSVNISGAIPSSVLSGPLSNGCNTSNVIGGVLLSNTTISAGAGRIGGLVLSNGMITGNGFGLTNVTLSGTNSLINSATTSNSIGGVTLSGGQIFSSNLASVIGGVTLCGGLIIGNISGATSVFGSSSYTVNGATTVSITAGNGGSTGGVVQLTNATGITTFTLSGGTLGGAGVAFRNSEGLQTITMTGETGILTVSSIQSGILAVSGPISNALNTSNSIGGLVLSNGVIGGNGSGLSNVVVRASNVLGLFSDICTNSDSTSNVIGGVTLQNGTIDGTFIGVVPTSTLSGPFSNAFNTVNTIGGVTLQNGSISGTIIVPASNITGAFSTSTLSGPFSNDFNTVNSIGGVTLQNGSISGTILVPTSNVYGLFPALRLNGDALTSRPDTSNYIGNVYLGPNGVISNASNTCNVIGGVIMCNASNRVLMASSYFDGGVIQLKDSNGVTKVNLYAGDVANTGGTVQSTYFIASNITAGTVTVSGTTFLNALDVSSTAQITRLSINGPFGGDHAVWVNARNGYAIGTPSYQRCDLGGVYLGNGDVQCDFIRVQGSGGNVTISGNILNGIQYLEPPGGFPLVIRKTNAGLYTDGIVINESNSGMVVQDRTASNEIGGIILSNYSLRTPPDTVQLVGGCTLYNKTLATKYIDVTDSPGSQKIRILGDGIVGGGEIYLSNASNVLTAFLQTNSYSNGGALTVAHPINAALRIELFGGTGQAYAVAWNVTSDLRLKTNIETLSSALPIVEALRPVTYNFRTDLSTTRCGFIAQEVEKVIPELATEINGQYSINMTGIIPFLTKAVQELTERVKVLESRLSQPSS